MNNCINCSGAIKPNSTTIHCDVCHNNLHLQCVGLTEGDMKFTRSKSKSVKVVCNNCSCNMNQFKNFKELTDSLRHEFTNSLNLIRADFEAQINNLKMSMTSVIPPSPVVQTEEIIQEVIERQKRQNNIIIFGIPEQDNSLDNTQRTEQDNLVTNNVLHLVKPSLQTNVIKIQRLGRYNLDNTRARPIKVTFDNCTEISDILRNGKNLKSKAEFNMVSLSLDRTPKQLEYYKLLKQQLTERIAKGENNLRIRHFNGVPKIVHLN